MLSSLGDDVRRARLVRRYHSRQVVLHGECFYNGLCDPIDDTERRIRETAGYKIGMNGVSLKVDSEGFWVASEVPLQVVSSSVGERLEETSNILSAGMPADPEQREHALRRPRAFIRERALALGISDPVVGLITGLDHDRIQVATYAEGETQVAALAIGPPRHGG